MRIIVVMKIWAVGISWHALTWYCLWVVMASLICFIIIHVKLIKIFKLIIQLITITVNRFMGFILNMIGHWSFMGEESIQSLMVSVIYSGAMEWWIRKLFKFLRWSGGGVFYNNTKNSVGSIYMPECAHHLDLRSPNPNDPIYVK